MEDYTVVFLTGSGEESWYVDQCYQRNVECVAEAYEACAFTRSVAVEHAGEIFGLVGYDTYRLSVHARETYYDVLGVVALDFEEFSVVDDRADHFVHVVRLVGAVGNDVVERIFQTVDRVGAFNQRWLFEVVLGNGAE